MIEVLVVVVMMEEEDGFARLWVEMLACSLEWREEAVGTWRRKELNHLPSTSRERAQNRS